MQTKTNHIAAISKKLSSIHVIILFIVYMVFSWVVGGRGMLHTEMNVRLPAHISGKPILQIIFDADSMNLGGWEARQLSFLFDVIDGNFVALSIRLGVPHFRSFTHFLFTFIIMLYMWSFLTRTLKLDRLLSLLLIALLLTTPSFVYAYYYRTSKIGVSLLVIILLGEMYKVLKGDIYLGIKIKKPFWLMLTFLFATLGLMLFDVLGGLFATVIIAYLFLALIYKPDRNKSVALAGMLTGYTIWVLYFLYLGPAIMLATTGQKADTAYLTDAPFQYFVGFLLIAIPPFIADMAQYLFGYITQSGGAIVLAWMLTTSMWLTLRPKKTALGTSTQGTAVSNSERTKPKFLSKLRSLISRYEPVLSMLFILGGITIIYALLVTRHAPILWPDVRPIYYIMPAQVALLFSVATLLARARIKWMLKFPGMHYFTIVLLAFFLLGNIRGSIYVKDVLFHGQNLDIAFRHDPALISSLANIHLPGFEPCDQVATDPIYQLFSKP